MTRYTLTATIEAESLGAAFDIASQIPSNLAPAATIPKGLRRFSLEEHGDAERTRAISADFTSPSPETLPEDDDAEDGRIELTLHGVKRGFIFSTLDDEEDAVERLVTAVTRTIRFHFAQRRNS